MGTLSKRAIRLIALVVTFAVLAGTAYYVLYHKSVKRLTAHFTSAVGVYKGSDVRVLGVKIGEIDEVIPEGTSVRVEMEYDARYKLPANAVAVIIPPSIVSDRYVQIAPAYTSGPVLADHGDIPLDRTAAPAELDDIYRALDGLSAALGPNGANRNGALSDLVNVLSANLEGTGTKLGQTVADLSQATRTLADNRENLFGTVKNLQAFSDALERSDAQVRAFNEQLAEVAGELADERQSLAAALHNLRTALTDVATFIKTNQASFHKDVTGLVAVTDVLAREQSALNESLAVAPTALANLAHTYNPSSGTLDNRSNLNSLTDPANVCGTLELLGKLPRPASDPLNTTCTAIAARLGTTLHGMEQLVSGVMDNLPTIPGLPAGGTRAVPGGLLPTVPGAGP